VVKWLKAFLLVLLILAAVTGYRYHNEDQAALEQARAMSGDLFLNTTKGLMRYQVYGEQNQSTVVLIHSFNGFMESWQANIQPLVAAGYRVVSYDLFGRGLSDRPRTVYDLKLFRTQLIDLMTALNIDNAHLVGASFGAVIAADFTLQQPDKVNSLAFIGPAGWPKDTSRSGLLDVPVLSDVVFHYLGESVLLPKVKAYFINPEQHPATLKMWQSYAAMAGFSRAALSTLQHAPVFDYTAGWQQLGTTDVPVLMIWGLQDSSFPYTNAEQARRLLPQARLEAVQQAAHWVNVEKPAVVNQLLQDWLRTHP
jgi:pimeloyl-ACP methyl ester carboxylesterase